MEHIYHAYLSEGDAFSSSSFFFFLSSIFAFNNIIGESGLDLQNLA